MQSLSVLLPCAFGAALIPLLSKLAFAMDWLDHPDARKAHEGAVPLVGGVAVSAAFVLGLAVLGRWNDLPPAFFHGAAMMLLIGMVDDRRPLPSLPRFALQALAIWIAFAAGGNVLADVGRLTGTALWNLGWWSMPLTVFGVLGVVNAINMSDGADGLAGGIAVSSLACFFAAFQFLRLDGALPATTADPSVAVLVLIGALLGFLVFNLRTPWRARASVFLGDSGSLAIGFALGWFAVAAAGQPGSRDLSPVAALWILIVPLFDTISCMIRRTLQGRSPMSADRQHAHHLLQALGLSMATTVWVLIGLNALGGIIGLTAWRLGVPDRWMFAAITALFVAYTVGSILGWKRLMRASVKVEPRMAAN
jgi:UDP-GlcNAc:undecaprenyl-phosphate/decaprenyl-phosphate GlcNAc-1-phosphate transferase